MKPVLAEQLTANLTESQRAVIADVIAAIFEAADPYQAVRGSLHLQDECLQVGEKSISLREIRKLILLGVGKASLSMASAAWDVIGQRIDSGLVITKHVQADLPWSDNCKMLTGGHPIPDERSISATTLLLNELQGITEDDLVLLLLSGGGSSLLTHPPDGISLPDLQQLTSLLLSGGANIGEINTVRKHLDTVKGGGLARAAWPAQVVTIILSDVVDNPLDQIASGPTSADPSTFSDAIAVLRRYGILEKTPPALLEYLIKGEDGDVPETCKPGDPIMTRVYNWVAGSNVQAVEAALGAARNHGMQTHLVTSQLAGEAREVGRGLGHLLRQCAEGQGPCQPPCLLAAGGETTVTRLSTGGVGGRNLELAAGAVEPLDGLRNVALMALATDGEDGSSQAAGALVTGTTQANSRSLGLDPQAAIDASDTFTYFNRLGQAIITGPSGTNVNDVCLMFAF